MTGPISQIKASRRVFRENCGLTPPVAWQSMPRKLTGQSALAHAHGTITHRQTNIYCNRPLKYRFGGALIITHGKPI